MKKMKTRIYGLLGIGSYNANWNADFTKHPKTLGDGTIFGSDKALKYSIRYFLMMFVERLNKKGLMFYKSFRKNEKGKLQPLDNGEKYEELFGKKITKNTSQEEVLNNLLSIEDVKLFGATFAGDASVSILGPVQIGQGLNKFEDATVHTQDILSPFRNSSNENAQQSSLGTQTFTPEAHYVYNFSLNPNVLDMYKGISNAEFTNEDFENFKLGALDGATALNTASKLGCENELGLFIHLNEDSLQQLPSLDNYIKVYKVNGKLTYDFTGLIPLLMDIKGEIKQIELYYNNYNIDIVGLDTISVIKKNIITKQEIK